MSHIDKILNELKNTKEPWLITHLDGRKLIVEFLTQDIIVWIVGESRGKIYVSDIKEVLDKSKYPCYFL